MSNADKFGLERRVVIRKPRLRPSRPLLTAQRRHEFGTLLRKLRLEKGLSCEALASRAGRMTRTSLATIERGKRPCGAVVSERLADALKLTDESRNDFLLAALRTTHRETLPFAARGFDPQLFAPIWGLLAGQKIRPEDIRSVSLATPLSVDSPEQLKIAARQLAKKSEHLSRMICEALSQSGGKHLFDLVVHTADGRQIILQTLSAAA